MHNTSPNHRSLGTRNIVRFLFSIPIRADGKDEIEYVRVARIIFPVDRTLNVIVNLLRYARLCRSLTTFNFYPTSSFLNSFFQRIWKSSHRALFYK